MKKLPNSPKTYFKANKRWETIVSIILLFYILPCLAFSRYDYLPTQVLGLEGVLDLIQKHQVAIRNIYFVVLVVHLTEAVLAAMICVYMDMDIKTICKWFSSVFVHGFLAFRYLLHRLYEFEDLQEVGSGLSPQVKMGLSEFTQ